MNTTQHITVVARDRWRVNTFFSISNKNSQKKSSTHWYRTTTTQARREYWVPFLFILLLLFPERMKKRWTNPCVGISAYCYTSKNYDDEERKKFQKQHSCWGLKKKTAMEGRRFL
jgi:hypothetical protein